MFVVQQGSPGWGYFMDVLEKILPPDQFLIRRYDGSKTIPQMVSDADAIILGTAQINRQVLDAASRLKLIHQHGRGVDSVDLAYATEKGVYVCNVPGGNSVSVAEHAMFLMLSLAKRFKACERSLRNRSLGLPPTMELNGKTLGIVGIGATGKELSRVAKAFGMKVLAVTEHPENKGDETRANLDFLGGLDKISLLLSNSDFVSLHLPLNQQTRRMVNGKWFAKMKPTAYLINTARGAIVDKDSLQDALKQGKIAGAGLDVFWEYPPDPDDELWKNDNVIVTPHMAGFSLEVYEGMGKTVSQNILRVAKGDIPMNIVNREVLGEG